MTDLILTDLICPACNSPMEGFDDGNGNPVKLQYGKRWEIAGSCPNGCRTFGHGMWTETSLRLHKAKREKQRKE